MRPLEAGPPRPGDDPAGNHEPTTGKASLQAVGGGVATPRATILAENEPIKAAEETLKTNDGLSEYERLRLARVAQNAQFLAQLGVKQAQKNVLSGLPVAKKRGRPPKRAREDGAEAPPPVRLAPSRRSSRLAGEHEALKTAEQREGEPKVDVEAEPQYHDPSVLRYSCSSVSPLDFYEEAAVPGRRTRSLVGFRQRASSAADSFRDPALQFVQTIAFSPFQENALVAAAGTVGRVSVFPAVPSGQQDADVAAPLLSFRACRETVSCLSFDLSTATGKTLLLTATRQEGVVKLWDLKQSGEETAKEPTPVLSQQLHSRGVYGMDVHGNQVLTCSGDATIALSLFREGESSLEVSRRYFTTQATFVRCVRSSPLRPSVFASGGRDRVLRVYDTRVEDSRASLEIPRAQRGAIYSISWHPSQEHTVLSAGIDPLMHLYDLRNVSKPLVTMDTAHMPLFNGDQSQGYDPCFVAQGECIVSAGSTRKDKKVSLHRTLDGRKISLGELPGRVTCMAVDPFADRLLLALGSRVQSFDFEWQEAINSVVV